MVAHGGEIGAGDRLDDERRLAAGGHDLPRDGAGGRVARRGLGREIGDQGDLAVRAHRLGLGERPAHGERGGDGQEPEEREGGAGSASLFSRSKPHRRAVRAPTGRRPVA